MSSLEIVIIVIFAKIKAYGDVILILAKLGIKIAYILPASTSPCIFLFHRSLLLFAEDE